MKIKLIILLLLYNISLFSQLKDTMRCNYKFNTYRVDKQYAKSFLVTGGITTFIGLSTTMLSYNDNYRQACIPFGLVTLGGLAITSYGISLDMKSERRFDSTFKLIHKPCKSDYIRFTAITLSGICRGLQESMKFYPNSFPNSSWNPDSTWRYKYKNGDPSQGEAFPLSTSLLVGLTDKYHGIGSIGTLSGLTYTATVTYKFSRRNYKNGQLAYKMLTECALSFFFYNLGKSGVMYYYRNK